MFSVTTCYRGHFDYVNDIEILDDKHFVSSNHVDKLKVID